MRPPHARHDQGEDLAGCEVPFAHIARNATEAAGMGKANLEKAQMTTTTAAAARETDDVAPVNAPIKYGPRGSELELELADQRADAWSFGCLLNALALHQQLELAQTARKVQWKTKQVPDGETVLHLTAT